MPEVRKRGFNLVLILLAAGVVGAVIVNATSSGKSKLRREASKGPAAPVEYRPMRVKDTSGVMHMVSRMKPWDPLATLPEIKAAFDGLGTRTAAEIDRYLSEHSVDADEHVSRMIIKACAHLFQAEPKAAAKVLEETRRFVKSSPKTSADWLYTIVFIQGVASLRQGEDENCVECRGEGSCIFPLGPTAVHLNREGSERATKFFAEYLERFPDDAGAKWLLNFSYMTLGEHPKSVPSQHLLSLDGWGAEMNIGRFKDIAHLVGVNRFGQAGGVVMDDFDNDGLLDLAVTDWGNILPMSFFRNNGKGTFDDRTKEAGLIEQTGGLNCSQTDVDNDGNLDLYISRGAWMPHPMRPSLLRNLGGGKFADVTEKSGMLVPSSSNCAAWADYDNDGFLDCFACNETGPNRLFRNLGNGAFEEVAAAAGVAVGKRFCKGAVWLDFDGDRYPDLFVSNFQGHAQLFRNNRNGTFTEVTKELGVTGPECGFTCWAFDFDNDGWLDIFATSYDRTLDDAVLDIQRKPLKNPLDRTMLHRNLGGKGFKNVAPEVGVDGVFAAMGSNFADFDNDGFLDFYLGTGEPCLSVIIPNRMFKNVGGRRFAEITATAGVGHLQKGHAVACGDWDRDGNVDMFVKVGGAAPGDQFHSALFQNPGHDNKWITVKLVGRKTNRPSIGARIKVVTDGEEPLTVYRHVGFGSSFGGNPLEQTIGLGMARRIARLEVYWPTSDATQVFENVGTNQSIEITEFAKDFRSVKHPVVVVPKE
jgi:hypothetical protein